MEEKKYKERDERVGDELGKESWDKGRREVG
jgi:hypothetical protein